jgi:nucleoid DNA-binding protein
MGVIRYKVVPKKNPIDNSVQFYAQPELYSQISREDIVEAAQRNTSIPRAYLDMAYDSLINEVENFVMNGHSVQIPNLGTISCRIRGAGAASRDKYTTDLISKVGFTFLPDPYIKKLLKKVQFRQVK